jgi:hypothetical protein
VQHAGHEPVFVPDAVMHYRHRPGLPGTVRQYFIWGASDARLYSAFRDRGVARDSRGAVTRAWKEILGSAGDLFDGWAPAGRWLCAAAYRLGRIRGSVRYRVVFL